MKTKGEKTENSQEENTIQESSRLTFCLHDTESPEKWQTQALTGEGWQSGPVSPELPSCHTTKDTLSSKWKSKLRNDCGVSFPQGDPKLRN